MKLRSLLSPLFRAGLALANRRSILVVLGFVVGTAVAPGAEVLARKGAPAAPIVKGSITKGSALCTRTAAHGKAWVTPWVAGKNAWLGRLDLAAGAKVPSHRDPTEEYIHVLSGHGTMTIDGETTTVGPGDTIFMPAGAEVSFQNGSEQLSAVQVFAGPEPATKYATWPGCK